MSIDQEERLKLLTEGLTFAIAETLSKTGNEQVVFAIVLHDQHLTHYMSNADRENGKQLLKHILDSWEEGQKVIMTTGQSDSNPLH